MMRFLVSFNRYDYMISLKNITKYHFIFAKCIEVAENVVFKRYIHTFVSVTELIRKIYDNAPHFQIVKTEHFSLLGDYVSNIIISVFPFQVLVRDASAR